jgi:hypothetical protein
MSYTTLLLKTFLFEISNYPKIVFEFLIFWNSNFKLLKQSHIEKWPKQKL